MRHIQTLERGFTPYHFFSKSGKGFTLIEMLAVVGVIVVITSIVLANNSRFGGVVLLENFSYDIALSVRQAQVYGIATVRFQQSNFNAPYGLHFDLSSSNTSYTFFADAVLPQDGIYDTGELVQTTNITRGFSIKSLCATPVSGPQVQDCTLSKLDVVYKRPQPDAYIRANGVGGTEDVNTYANGRIVIQSPREDTMSVVMFKNGQISVQRCDPITVCQ
ncbi:MAG: hypothetical protein UY70_C0030G0012 [Candidatus Kaiserbacteria bacterium GW2011_GWB1_52_6]|uniref:Prepilin-type N-terminal cleavage/methylation domain-containing protein n=2 Tax=Candidatus Kaiseribacteriota TaxID=1752734 RepID=A0A0G1X568_9BACT|nr:MAG: hypothetical protein UY67_C0025G0012 [Candidatus Kaiserbacteria bacterium GW2011_GWA2_52_12]KKW26288.1 MAG: hypothetical protein UY70_C0030G0012 [Candidatus Kaiserbacteria bacterium GW2011_GWB1_52_6]